MDYKVIFTETFVADLELIISGIAHENAPAARRLGELIIARAEALTFFPERHPRVRQRPSMRRYVVARHFKVFYRVLADRGIVEVLRCWDGRRAGDPPVA